MQLVEKVKKKEYNNEISSQSFALNETTLTDE